MLRSEGHPWVTHNPRLTATIIILRRIGYTLLSIFKKVTQRSDHRRHEPWHILLTRMHCACGAPALSRGPYASVLLVITTRTVCAPARDALRLATPATFDRPR